MPFHLQLGSFKLSLGKSLSPDMQAFMNATDVTDDAGAKLVTPYAQSSWVYIAVSRLAEKLAQIPFRISRIGGAQSRRVRSLRHSADPRHRQFCRRAMGEDILESGDVVDLFENPHPTMPKYLFWEMLMTWLALRGEAFIIPMDADDMPVNLADRNPKIKRLITLPTELFWHIVTGYELTGWRYTGSPLLTPIPSEILLPSEVVQLRTPNPYLYWRGMSPLVVALVAAGADYAAAQYSKGYWLNNADTGVIVTTDQQATPEQQAAIGAALRERKRKAGTADRPLFLWGGAKVEKPQLTGMEHEFIENRKLNRQEIAAIFKVPDAVMGFSQSKGPSLSGGGSELVAELVNFIENSMGPTCAQIESALDPIVKTFGDDLVGWFDLDSLPVMQAARRDRLDAAGKAFNLGAAFNDINLAYDLGFPDYAWGNTSFLPFNLQPVDSLLNPALPGEGTSGPAIDPEDAEDGGPDGEPNTDAFKRLGKLVAQLSAPAIPHSELRAPNSKLAVLWNSHVATRRKTVKVFEGKSRKVIHQFRAKVLAKLDEVHLQKGVGVQASACPVVNRSLIDLIFNPHDFGAVMQAELVNPIRNTLQLAGNELHQEIGLDDPWKMADPFVKAFLAGRDQPIRGCGQTVRDQLNTSLQQGVDAGETHAQLMARVSQVFGNLNKYEASRIALTEVNTAYNAARHQSMTDAGIRYKAWLSSHGPTVREAHAQAEEDYIDDPIPVDDPFEVGGEYLMYPGDDSQGAGPGNTINCQCIQLAAEKKSEDEKSATYQVFGFGDLAVRKDLET